jgi:hypothetical protein
MLLAALAFLGQLILLLCLALLLPRWRSGLADSALRLALLLSTLLLLSLVLLRIGLTPAGFGPDHLAAGDLSCLRDWSRLCPRP